MLHDHDTSRGPGRAEKDRRTVRRVAAFGAAAVAVTALVTAGVAQNAGAAADPAAPSGQVLLGVPGASATEPPAAAGATAPPIPEVAGEASPSNPQLRVSIGFQRIERTLTLTISFNGSVHEPYSTATDQPLAFPTPAKRDIGLGETLSWGDGTNADAPSEGKRCAQGDEARVVHEIEDSYSVAKTYAEPGTYNVDYTYFACGLTDGKISGALEIVVP